MVSANVSPRSSGFPQARAARRIPGSERVLSKGDWSPLGGPVVLISALPLDLFWGEHPLCLQLGFSFSICKWGQI